MRPKALCGRLKVSLYLRLMSIVVTSWCISVSTYRYCYHGYLTRTRTLTPHHAGPLPPFLTRLEIYRLSKYSGIRQPERRPEPSSNGPSQPWRTRTPLVILTTPPPPVAPSPVASHPFDLLPSHPQILPPPANNPIQPANFFTTLEVRLVAVAVLGHRHFLSVLTDTTLCLQFHFHSSPSFP